MEDRDYEYEKYEGPDRRHPLTVEELEWIKRQLLESIYAEIGRSIVKKMLWILGTATLALFAWLAGKGYIDLNAKD